MKKLYAVGCSFTHGDELTDPVSEAWPVLLSNRLNMEVVNDAVPGGTNQRSCYQLLKNFGTADLYVIAWTTYARFTFHKSDTNYEVNFTPILENSHYGQEDFFKSWGRILYTEWFNELFAFKQWLQQIIYTQTLLKSQNYIMVNTMGNHIDEWCTTWDQFIPKTRSLVNFDIMDDSQLFDEFTEIQHYLSLIDFSKFYKWGQFSITDLCAEYPCGPGGHLLTAGHQQVANLLHKFYVQNQDSNR